MLIIGRYSGVSYALIHGRIQDIEKLTPILTLVGGFHEEKVRHFYLFRKPPFCTSERLMQNIHEARVDKGFAVCAAWFSRWFSSLTDTVLKRYYIRTVIVRERRICCECAKL